MASCDSIEDDPAIPLTIWLSVDNHFIPMPRLNWAHNLLSIADPTTDVTRAQSRRGCNMSSWDQFLLESHFAPDTVSSIKTNSLKTSDKNFISATGIPINFSNTVDDAWYICVSDDASVPILLTIPKNWCTVLVVCRGETSWPDEWSIHKLKLTVSI